MPAVVPGAAPSGIAAADLAMGTLPADVKTKVEAVLADPAKEKAFLANAKADKLPEIQARITALAQEKNLADPAVVSSRKELAAWVKSAVAAAHDWSDPEAGAAFKALVAAVKARHDKSAAQLDARAAGDPSAPIVDGVREQLQGHPELEVQLKAFKGQLSTYLKSGSDSDMNAALGAMDALYQKAGVHDDGQRAQMFAAMAAQARAQSKALSVAPDPGKPAFTAFTAPTHAVSDLDLTVPSLTLGGTTASAYRMPDLTGLRDAVRNFAPAAPGGWTGALAAVMPPTLPGLSLNPLSDNAARLASGLEKRGLDAKLADLTHRVADLESRSAAADPASLPTDADLDAAAKVADGLKGDADAAPLIARLAAVTKTIRDRTGASRDASKSLTDAYRSISGKITDLIKNAPYRDGDPSAAPPVPAASAKDLEKFRDDWAKTVSEILLDHAVVLEAEGDGLWNATAAADAKIGGAAILPGDADGLKAARDRAKLLVDLLKALNGKVDVTGLLAKDRERLLGSGDKDLGIYGRAQVKIASDQDARRANGDKIMASIAALGLNGDAAHDKSALDKLFANADTLKALDQADLPPAVAAYVAARKREASGATTAPVPGQPSADEAYRDVLFADRLAAQKSSPSGERKEWAGIFLAAYDVNRKSYLALGCDPRALGMPADAAATASHLSTDEADFCSRFVADQKMPADDVSDDELKLLAQRQQELTNLARAFIQGQPLLKAVDADQKARAELLGKLRDLSATDQAAIAYLKKKGVDVDGLLHNDRKLQLVAWLMNAHEQKLDDDPAFATDWENARRELFGDEAVDAVTAQGGALKKALADPAPTAQSLAAAVNGFENPGLITTGYAQDIPKLLASPRAKQSARDRDLLAAWQGQAAHIRDIAAQREAQAASLPKDSAQAKDLLEQAAAMRAAADDPKDTARLLRAFNLAGSTVLDERTMRVGLDAQKVKVPPSTAEEKQDVEALDGLMRVLKIKGDPIHDSAVAAQLRKALLDYLGGTVVKQQNDYRGTQLLLSVSDQYTDKVRKLDAVVGGAPGAGSEPAAADKILSTKAMQELKGFSDAAVTAMDDLAAQNAAAQESARTSAGGRALLGLSSAMLVLRAQSEEALRSDASPAGLVVDGWTIGSEGKVTRERDFATSGAARDSDPVSNGLDKKLVAAVAGDAPSANAPRARAMDGLVTTNGETTSFTSLKGDYTQTIAAATIQERKDGPVLQIMHANIPGAQGPVEVRYDPVAKKYYTQVATDVKSTDAKGGVHWNVVQKEVDFEPGQVPTGGFHQVQRVVIDDRTGKTALRSTVDQVQGGEILRYSNSFLDAKGRPTVTTSVDLEAHSLDVTRFSAAGPTKRVAFDLAASNAGLADSRRITTTTFGGGAPATSSTWLEKDKDKGTVTVFRETSDSGWPPDQGPSALRVVSSLTGNISGQTAADQDRSLLAGRAAAPAAGTAISATVHVDRNGMTDAQVRAAYETAAQRAGVYFTRAGKVAGDGDPGDYSAKLSQLMNFYDGQVSDGRTGSPAIVDASFSVNAGGGVASRLSYYNAKTRGLDQVKLPYLTYTALPDKAPLDPVNASQAVYDRTLRTQTLAAMRQATGQAGLFVSHEGGRDQFFDPDSKFKGGENGLHTINLVKPDSSGLKGWSFWGGKPINAAIMVDGSAAGSIQTDQTGGISNFNEIAGEYVGNGIQYKTPYFSDHFPKTMAALGAVGNGLTSGALDPKLWLVTVATMGGGLLVEVAAESSIAAIRLASTIGKVGLKVVEVGFQVQLVEGGLQAGGAFIEYAKTGDNAQLCAALKATSSMAVGFIGLHLAKGGLEAGNEFVRGKVGLETTGEVAPGGGHEPAHETERDAGTHNSPAPDTTSHETAPPPDTTSHETAPPPDATSHETAPPPDATSHETAPPPDATSHETAPPPDTTSHETAPPPDGTSHETAPPPDAAPRSAPPVEPPPAPKMPAMPRVASESMSGGGTLDAAPSASALSEGGSGAALKPDGGFHAASNEGAGAPKAEPAALAEPAPKAEVAEAAPAEMSAAPEPAPAAPDPAALQARETAQVEAQRSAQVTEQASAARESASAAETRAAEADRTAAAAERTAAKTSEESSADMRMADIAEQRAGETANAAEKAPSGTAEEAMRRATEARTEAKALREKAAETSARSEAAKTEASAAAERGAQAHEEADVARGAAQDASAAERAQIETARVAETAAARAESAAAERTSGAEKAPGSAEPEVGAKSGDEGGRGERAAAEPDKPRSKWEAFKKGAKSLDDALGRTMDAVEAKTKLLSAEFEGSKNPLIAALRTPLRMSRTIGAAVERFAQKSDIVNELGIKAWRAVFGGGPIEHDAAGRRLTEVKGKDGVTRKVPAGPGFLSAPLMQAGQILQGRFFGGGRLQTAEEIWSPRLTDRGSLTAALPKTLPPEGAAVPGVLDLATGDLLLGAEAARFTGPDRAEVRLRVEPAGPDGAGRVLADYELAAKGPADLARAEAVLAEHLKYELEVPRQQAALQDVLTGPEARAAMSAHRDAGTGETFLDVHFDRGAGEFRAGASDDAPGARLRFAPDGRLSAIEPSGKGSLPLIARYNLGLAAHLAVPEAAAPAAEQAPAVASHPESEALAARYERYLSMPEILAAHPSPESGGVYHDWQHSVKVADMAREFAEVRRARDGLSEGDVKFITEVGLLHDFDPTRAAGMPARVPDTLARLREDFAGTKSLTGEPGRSLLKERFGWDESKLKMAEAMIQRTEFPFGEKHPSPAYKGTSPLEQYELMLKGLDPAQRNFVLREGALLSEYADKSSWYATEDFAGAHKTVEGLVDEINRTLPPGVAKVDAGKLGTDGFLGKIGEPDSFVYDRALAEKFGATLDLPNRAEAFALLPEKYGKTFESNLEGFRVLNEAAKAGDPRAFEKGLAAASAARKPAPPTEETALAPEPAVKRTPAEKTDGLRQLKKSLEARGQSEALVLAEKLYYTDALTGLPNRAYYLDRAAEILKGVADPAVAMLDMNNFGAVNVGLADLHGVTEGRARADKLLGRAGAALDEVGRAKGVTVVRLGGEEFVVLGSRDAVVEFSRAAKEVLRPQRLLDEGGMASGSPERAAIEAAMLRMDRGGQPVADFTYGVAELRGRPVAEAVTAADQALGHGKEAAGRGAITLEAEDGGFTDLNGAAASPVPDVLPPARTADVGADVARLEKMLIPKEKAVFAEAAFKDPLTWTRTYDYIGLKADAWNAEYADGGMSVLSSARNFKQINDILGHDAGDVYLRRLGVITRSVVNKARVHMHLDVQEPVRVASKEFMIIGRDAEQVTRLVSDEVARKFSAGEILPLDQVKLLREQAVSRKSMSPEGAELIGTLRTVSEPLADASGRADVKAALDRAFEHLEEVKQAETAAGARAASPAGADGAPTPPPPLKPVMKPSDLRAGGPLGEGGAASVMFREVLGPPTAEQSASPLRVSPGFRAVLESARSAPMDGLLPGRELAGGISEAAAAEALKLESLLRRATPDPDAHFSASTYESLPPALREFGEKFYGETAAQASPRAIARSERTSGGDPAWWSDHGVNHMINIVENSPVVLDAATKAGLIEARPAGRHESMELMGKVNAVFHDMWMKDLTPEGRKQHPARASREAFSAEVDRAADDILASKMSGGRTFREVLRDVYKIDDADVPRVLREMMAMSFAHSKSNVPLEVLNDPVRLRDVMKRVVSDPETEVPFQRFYEAEGPNSFDAKAFDWLTSGAHPELAEDMVDVSRVLRVADSFRWRGSADFRASNGANIGIAEVHGKVNAYMRLADQESGRTYMVLYDSSKVMGEANIGYSRLDPDGALAMGVEKGDFGSPENTRTVIDGSADIIYDVAKDYAESFKSGAQRIIRIEIPAETPRVADMIKEELLSLADKDAKSPAFAAALRAAVADGRVEFVLAEPAHEDVAAAKKFGADMEKGRFIRAPEPRLTAEQAARLADAIRDGGVNIDAVAFPEMALAGAREVTLAKGEFLVARGMPADFVYLTLDDGGLQPLLGKSYKAAPLRRGVLAGELGVLTGNPRNADVVAIRDGVKVLAIPKETYLSEWTKTYYTHDTILDRLKTDYPADEAAPAAPPSGAKPSDAPAVAPAAPAAVVPSGEAGFWGRLMGGDRTGVSAPERVLLEAGAMLQAARRPIDASVSAFNRLIGRGPPPEMANLLDFGPKQWENYRVDRADIRRQRSRAMDFRDQFSKASQAADALRTQAGQDIKAASDKGVQKELAAARDAQVSAKIWEFADKFGVDGMKADELTLMFNTFKDHGLFADMVKLYDRSTNADFKEAVVNRQLLAVALHKTGDWAGSERVILSQPEAERSGEDYAILGKIYKLKYETAEKAGNADEARAALDQSISYLEKGFAKDYEFYPGINLVYNLMTKGVEFHDPAAIARAEEKAQLVLLAAKKAGGLHSNDFWTLGTMLESSVIIGSDREIAAVLPKVLSSASAEWMIKAPIENLTKLRAQTEILGGEGKAEKLARLDGVIEALQARLESLHEKVAAPAPRTAGEELARAMLNQGHSFSEMARRLSENGWSLGAITTSAVGGNVPFGGQLHSALVNRWDFGVGRDLLAHLGVDSKTDMATFNRTVDAAIRERFGTDKDDLEDLHSDGHKVFDAFTKTFLDVMAVGKDGDSRTNIMVDFLLGKGDCRHHAYVKQLLFDIWKTDKMNALMSEADADLERGDKARFDKSLAAVGELERVRMLTFDSVLNAPIQLGEKGKYDPALTAKGEFKVGSKEEAVEDHTWNGLVTINDAGELVDLRMVDSFYQHAYKFGGGDGIDVPLDKVRLTDDGKIDIMSSVEAVADDGTKESIPVRMSPTRYAGSTKVNPNWDDYEQVRMRGLEIVPGKPDFSAKTKSSIDGFITNLLADEYRRQLQYDALTKTLKDKDFALEMAAWQDGAYYRGQGKTPPPFLTPEERTQTVEKSVADEKVAMNLAGFYADESGVGVLAERTGRTPAAVIDAMAKGELSRDDMLLIARFANATWKAGQPFRGLDRITRDTFRPAVLLTDTELKKDFVQIQAAASKLSEKMADVKDAPREAQLARLSELLKSKDFALEMAAWQDGAYYRGQGQEPPPFLSDAEKTGTVTKSVKEEKIAMNLAGFYAVESGIGMLAETTGQTPRALLQSIVDGKMPEPDMLLIARFANATWKAGQPFRSLDRITRDTFRPAALLTDPELAKDFDQIKAASEKLLERVKVLEVAGMDDPTRLGALKALKASDMPSGTWSDDFRHPIDAIRRLLGLRLMSDAQAEAVMRAHNDVPCDVYRCTPAQLFAKARIMNGADIPADVREKLIREGYAGSLDKTGDEPAEEPTEKKESVDAEAAAVQAQTEADNASVLQPTEESVDNAQSGGFRELARQEKLLNQFHDLGKAEKAAARIGVPAETLGEILLGSPCAATPCTPDEAEARKAAFWRITGRDVRDAEAQKMLSRLLTVTGIVAAPAPPPPGITSGFNAGMRLTSRQATEAAKALGYLLIADPPFNTHGQPAFKKGARYISPDIDGHNGGVWKMFDSRGERKGTYNADLSVRIKG